MSETEANPSASEAEEANENSQKAHSVSKTRFDGENRGESDSSVGNNPDLWSQIKDKSFANLKMKL